MKEAENNLEKEAAVKKGFDEANFLNTHDQVAEGCGSNDFWVKDGNVDTPSLHCGILEGTARARIIKKCAALQIPFQEGAYALEELLRADEVFVTNALMDVMPVSLLEERHLDLGAYQVVPQLQGNGR